MIRGIAEVIGWLLLILVLLKQTGTIDFALYITAPNTCTKEPAVQTKPKTEHPLIVQLKRDARRLTKTAPYTHSQALEQLAQQQGYRTYAALRASLKETTA